MIRGTFLCAILTLAGSGTAKAQPATEPPAPQTAPQTAPQPAPQPAPERPKPPAPIFRHADVDLAWRAAQKTGRPVMVFVTMDNCHFCKKMVAETFSHPQIARATNQRFETAVLSREKHPALVEKLGVRAFPTTLVVKPDGSLQSRVEGFVQPAEFVAEVFPQPGAKRRR